MDQQTSTSTAEFEVERQSAEDWLREREALFRNMFAYTATGIATSTPQGRFLHANAAYCEMLGYTEEELRSFNFAELTHPDDRALNLKLRDEVLAGVRDSLVMEKRYLKKNGDIVWTLNSVSAARAADGKVTMFIVVAENITERKRAEEQLLWKTAFLEAQVNSALDGMLVVDSNGMKILQNQRMIDLWEIPEDIACEAEHSRRFAWIKGQIKNPVPQLFAEKVAWLYSHPDEVSHDELELINGKHLDRYSAPVRGNDGKYYGRIWVYRDITERKLAEEALRQSEERLRLITDLVPQGIFAKDAAGRHIFANPAFALLAGLPIEEILGKNDFDLVADKAQAEAFRAEDRTVIQSGSKMVISEQPRTDFSGHTRLLQTIKIPFTLAETDELGVLGVCTDITEQKRVEARFRRLVDSNAQAVFLWKIDGQITDSNDAFLKITGYTREDLLGGNINWAAMTPPEYTEQDQRALKELATTGVSSTYEKEWISKGGTRVPILLGSAIFEDNPNEGVAFALDLTERKKLEHQFMQAQKMESIGLLAGGIAHDFNNLLTVINGYSDVLIDSLPPNDPSQRFLSFIKKAGEQSSALTKLILSFSRNQFLAPKAINLNDVVRKVEKMLRRVIGEDIRLFTGLRPELSSVMADQTQMEQILLNLAVNARDAMPTGGKLTIETKHVDLDESYAHANPDIEPGPYVMLAVTDTGSGMPEDVKPHIFEPFFTTKGVGKGTGLGLSVVHGIVKRSRGSIEVYSEPGQGTCFKIYLPQIAGSAAMKAADDARVLARGSETILLVEDEENLREFARHVLEGCGYTLLVVGNSREALRISAQHNAPIHLLLTDVVMPETGGRALAEQLQRTRPAMKVLFMSGYTEDAVVRHGILTGEVNFLEKPFSPFALAEKIREVLNSGGMQKEVSVEL